MNIKQKASLMIGIPIFIVWVIIGNRWYDDNFIGQIHQLVLMATWISCFIGIFLLKD